MGSHSNYSDQKMGGATDDAIDRTPEYTLGLNEARRCSGDGRASGGAGPSLSELVERSMGGDWSWKPHRNARFPQFEMPRLHGSLRGPAELYRREAFPRS